MTRRGTSLAASFRFATAGLRFFFTSQRNARLQALAGLAALALGALLRLSGDEWALLILTIVLVLALETVNTALETVVDLVTRDEHPLAQQAKDLAAGAVWLASLGALGVGAFLFLPRLWALFGGA